MSVSASGEPMSDDVNALVGQIHRALDVLAHEPDSADEAADAKSALDALVEAHARQEAALRDLLAVCEEVVARKTNSDPEKSGAEYWAAQTIGVYEEAVPGISRRIRLARAVLIARAALLSPSERGSG